MPAAAASTGVLARRGVRLSWATHRKRREEEGAQRTKTHEGMLEHGGWGKEGKSKSTHPYLNCVGESLGATGQGSSVGGT